jgi:hypothetical protein
MASISSHLNVPYPPSDPDDLGRRSESIPSTENSRAQISLSFANESSIWQIGGMILDRVSGVGAQSGDGVAEELTECESGGGARLNGAYSVLVLGVEGVERI